MKVKKFLILCFSVVILSSCSKSSNDNNVQNTTVQSETSNISNNYETRDIFAMDTYMSLKAYGEDVGEALDKASERIYELENILSVTSENSDIYKINQLKSAIVSNDTVNILNTALYYGNETNGALDITIYPILKLWGFTTGNYRIPENNEIQSLLKYVDYKQVSINGNNVDIPEEVQIDLGALAKGYTSDEVINTLKEYKVESAIVSLGGNVQALGSKPDGSMWTVAVRNPFAPDENMCIVKIENEAVITSGNYERYFIGNDDNSYWHIIDSADGFPADNGLVSVTIIGESGLICDSLSTSLFVMGLDRAINYWKNNSNFDMIIVTDDAKVYYTQGIADNFENISTMPSEVIGLA